jgi:Mg2+-importing ATPase
MTASPSGELAAPGPEAVLRRLGTRASGLTAAEVDDRLGRLGRNELEAHHRKTLEVLAAQLRSPLVGLLGVAAGLSIAVGEGVDGTIILTILAVSAGLGFLNEYRSERTLDALRTLTGRRATVVRDGRTTVVPAARLVPGDICRLELGDVVPADVQLISSSELTVDESSLTGEAFPVEKSAAGDPTVRDGATSPALAFSGSVVRSGHGRGVVVATGERTRIGQVAGGIGARQPPTAFQRGLSAYTGLLARVTALLTVFIFVVNTILGRPVLDALLFSLAIAVGLTPQLLPAIVTVSLSTGARRMAARRVLVKRLVSIEDLGDADTLFTDKTGTLTLGEIELRACLGPTAEPDDDVGRLGLACTELDEDAGGAALGNPLDLALARSLQGRQAPLGRPVATVPFTFDRRRTSVVLEDDGRRTLVCKGAAEEVLARCSTVQVGGRPAAIESAGEAVTATLERIQADGHRALAVARRPVPVADAYGDAAERDLELVGFLVFADPAKPDAADAVAKLRRLGVELKVLTGDSARTTAHVCREVGLPVRGVLHGDELAALDDDELAARVDDVTIFARVDPAQKARVVAAEQRRGRDVAFLGDGVNDAVALHRADVGISVDSAVDVAREAADVVLLEKSLAVLADGVVEGRRIFANTMKYVLMGTSSNFGNMFSAAGASLFLSFLPMLPSQILLNNLLYDASELTIPTDRVDEELLVRPGHWDVRFIRRFMLFFGPLSSLYDFATFAVMLGVFDAGAPLFRSGWFVESLSTQALVVFVIRTRRSPFWQSRPSRPLLVSTLAVVVVGVILPYTPVATALGFEALPPAFLAILVVMVVTYLALAEVGKRRFFRSARAQT